MPCPNTSESSPLTIEDIRKAVIDLYCTWDTLVSATFLESTRTMRGLSQEPLEEKAGNNRSLLSAIEAPNVAEAFSLEVFSDIADVLH